MRPQTSSWRTATCDNCNNAIASKREALMKDGAHKKLKHKFCCSKCSSDFRKKQNDVRACTVCGTPYSRVQRRRGFAHGKCYPCYMMQHRWGAISGGVELWNLYKQLKNEIKLRKSEEKYG